ncbi:DUF4236 domain-containing protein [Mesorhizobium sp. M0092]|nr:DUF4236 domain-containing protein [Mesorhizobium sp. LSHC420B00]
MIVQAADFPAASFDSVAGDCADKSGGRILFNVRVNSHADVQRVAAVASKSDGGMTPLLLLLDRTGTSIKIHEVPVEDYPLVVSIARWANQPLHSQAITSVNVEVTPICKDAPGVRINLNAKSASVRVGPKGLGYTVSTTGKKRLSASIPGTGLSYSKVVSSKRQPVPSVPSQLVASQTKPSSKGPLALVLFAMGAGLVWCSTPYN